MLEDFLKLSIIINGKLLPLLFRVIKGDKKVYEGAIPFKVREYLKLNCKNLCEESVIEEVVFQIDNCIKKGEFDPLKDDVEKVFHEVIVSRLIPNAALSVRMKKEKMFNEYLNDYIEIMGRQLPLYTSIYDGKGFKNIGWIPKAVRKYLRKSGKFEYEDDIVNEVLMRINNCIMQGKFDPSKDDKSKFFSVMVTKYFIPQVAVKVLNFRSIASKDKVQIEGDSVYILHDCGNKKDNYRKELIGETISSKLKYKGKSKIKYIEQATGQIKTLYYDRHNYVTEIKEDISLDTAEDLIKSKGNEEDYYIIENDSIVFSTLMRLLEINDDVFKKILFIYYLVEFIDSKGKCTDFFVSRINNELMKFFSLPIEYLCNQIVQNYNSRYQFRLKIALERAIEGIEKKTIEALARRSGNYDSNETNWIKRLNEWRLRTQAKLKIYLENEYLKEGFLLDYIKKDVNHFDMGVYIYSRIGEPKFLSMSSLYREIANRNYEELIGLIRLKKVRNRMSAHKIEHLLYELEKHKHKYGKDSKGKDRYQSESKLKDILQEISRNIHKELFNKL